MSAKEWIKRNYMVFGIISYHANREKKYIMFPRGSIGTFDGSNFTR